MNATELKQLRGHLEYLRTVDPEEQEDHYNKAWGYLTDALGEHADALITCAEKAYG